MNEREVSDVQFEVRKKIFATQAERELYLQEFKENIIISVNKSDLEKNVIVEEVLEAMHEPDAIQIKMRRDIPLKFLKPYIDAAEKLGIRYTLIDDFTGDIGLVVVSKDTMDNKEHDITLESAVEKFVEAGLSPSYMENLGKKICSKHYELLAEKLPIYRGSFKKMGIWDKLTGYKCPICEYERKK